MNIIHRSMRRPITVVVGMVALVLSALFALSRMPRDILPDLGVPEIILVQPYGGMDATQMEGYITYFYEYNFLYVAGIEHTESRSIQGVSMIKLQFYPGTDMSRAMAEVINFANRALASMPSGIVPPFLIRFDAGSEPVGKLVFRTNTRSLAEVQDYANNVVRPLFSTLPGIAAPPPFGSSQRAVIINVNPKKLAEYNLSPYDVAESVANTNKVSGSGNIRVGNLYPAVRVNSVVDDLKELENVPLRLGTYPTVYLKDVAEITDSADIQTGYALVNGRRTVYIPVVKRFDASTLAVVDAVKKNLSRFQEALPADITVSYEFDQSGAVREAIRSLSLEGILGALLTGLMVMIFLQSWRSALIVTLNIPLAVAGAITGLWLVGQTVNIMTLGGLALAIGILVDETTITIENIHSHRQRGKSLAQSVLDATNEIIVPCLLTMLCVLAVFTPSFFMIGVAKALFQPLSLAVGFAVIASFFLARTLVPVLSVWLLPRRVEHTKSPFFEFLQARYARVTMAMMKHRVGVVAGYLVTVSALLFFVLPRVGQEIFPRIDSAGFQLRLRAPTGTYLDQTEILAKKTLDFLRTEAGPENIDSTNAFVGTVVGSSANNVIYLWTSGPHEAVIEVNLRRRNHVNVPDLQDRLRHVLAEQLPEVQASFEPLGVLNRVMSQGSPTPIEVAIAGPSLATSREFATKVRDVLNEIPTLRDLQYGQVFEYPTVGVDVDRKVAGERGFTTERIGRTVIPATSSSRLVLRNFWADKLTGYGRQIQIQVPMEHLASFQDIAKLPIGINGGAYE